MSQNYAPGESMLLGQREAAKQIGIAYSTMRKLWRTEGFPAVRIGRRCLVDREGLREWVNARRGDLREDA